MKSQLVGLQTIQHSRRRCFRAEAVVSENKSKANL